MNSSHEIKQIISQFGYKRLADLQDLGHAPTDIGSSAAGSSDLAGILSRKGYSGPASGETFARGLMPGIEGAEKASGISLAQNNSPGALLHTFVYGCAPYHSLRDVFGDEMAEAIDLSSVELIRAANEWEPIYQLPRNKESNQPIVYRTADLIAPSCGPAQEYFQALPGSDNYYQGYDVNAGTRDFVAGIPRTSSNDSVQYVAFVKDDILGVRATNYTSYINGAAKLPEEGDASSFEPYIYLTSNIWYTDYHYALSEHVNYFVEGAGPYTQPSSFLAGTLKQELDPTLHRAIFLAADSSLSIYKAGGARIDPAIWLFTMKTSLADIIMEGGDALSFDSIINNINRNPAITSKTTGLMNKQSTFYSDADPAGLTPVIVAKDNGTGFLSTTTNCGWTMDIEYNLINLMGATGIDARNAAIEVVGGKPIINNNKVQGFVASFTPGSPAIIYYPAIFQRTGLMAATTTNPNISSQSKIYFKRGFYPLPFSSFSFSVGVEVFGDTMVITANAADDELKVAIAPNLGVQEGWITLEGGFQSSLCELDSNIMLNVSRAAGKFSWRPAVYKSWNGAHGMFEYEISHLSADAQLADDGVSIIYNPKINPGNNEIQAKYKVTPRLVEQQIDNTPLKINSNSNINYEFSVTPPDVIPDARRIDGRHRLALEVRALKTISPFNTQATVNSHWSKGVSVFSGDNDNIAISELLSNEKIQEDWGFGFIGRSLSIASIAGMFQGERKLKFIKRPIPCIILWADTWANSQAVHIWPNKLPQEWITMVEARINSQSYMKDMNISFKKDIESITITTEIDGLILKKTCNIKIINPNKDTLNYINYIKSRNDGYGDIQIDLKGSDYESGSDMLLNKIRFSGFITSLNLSNTHMGTEIKIDMQDPFSLMMQNLIYPANHSIDGWSPEIALKYLLYRTGLKVDISDIISLFNQYGFLPKIYRIGKYIATDFNAASQQFNASNLSSNLNKACGPILYYHYPLFYWDEIRNSIIGTTLDYHLMEQSMQEISDLEISNNFANRLLKDNSFSYLLNNNEIKYNIYIKTQDRFRGSPMWTAIGDLSNNGGAEGYKSSKVFNASEFVQVAEHLYDLKENLEMKFIPYAIKPTTDLHVAGLPLASPLSRYNSGLFCGLMGVGSKLPNFVLPSLTINFDPYQWSNWMYANKTSISWDASTGNYIQSTICYQTLKSPLELGLGPFGVE